MLVNQDICWYIEEDSVGQVKGVGWLSPSSSPAPWWVTQDRRRELDIPPDPPSPGMSRRPHKLERNVTMRGNDRPQTIPECPPWKIWRLRRTHVSIIMVCVFKALLVPIPQSWKRRWEGGWLCCGLGGPRWQSPPSNWPGLRIQQCTRLIAEYVWGAGALLWRVE